MLQVLLRSIPRLFRRQKIKHDSRTANFATEAKLKVDQPFKLHKLKSGPAGETTVKKEEALKIYKQMVVIRELQKKNAELYREKKIRGFLHLYSGQEAIAVGIKSVLDKNDLTITAYRCHGWAHISCNCVDPILTELTGRVTGMARGKGGSMHLYTPDFFGGNGIVGAQVPVGTGIALSLKYKGLKNVCVTAYGDGASNQGQVFEAYNIAKLQNLPCIYLCENNMYGMGTSHSRSSANNKYYTRGDYIPGIWADGMDICAMREVTRFAKAWCLSGKGPIVIEANTYRYFGHSMSDPGYSYRSRDEIKKTRQERDPIAKFKSKIIAASLVTEDELKKIDNEAKVIIKNAAKAALSDQFPPLEELAYDIYLKNLRNTCRGTNLFEPLPVKNIGTPLNPK